MPTALPPKTRLLALLTAGLLYAALTLLFFHPDPRFLDEIIAPDTGDPLFNLTLLKWGAAQWSSGLPDYWNAPFFHPTAGTITLSDHLLGPSAAVALLGLGGVDPVSSYNGLFLSSFVLCGLATFWVLRRSGLSWGAAFAGGLIFAFSPFRLDQRPHLQVLLPQLVPLVLYSWDRFLERRRIAPALLFLGLYGLHLSGGNYLAYMIHLPLAAILVVRGREQGSRFFERRGLAVLAVVALAAGALMLAIFLPYLTTAPSLEVERQDEDWRAYGATLASFVTPSPANVLFPPQAWRLVRPENVLFAGLLPSLLALLGLILLWRGRGRAVLPRLSTGARWALAGLLSVAAAAFGLGELRTLARGGRFAGAEPFFQGWSYPRLFLLLALALLLAGWLWRRGGGKLPSLPASLGTWKPGIWKLGTWERGLLAGGGLSLLLCWPIFFVPLARVLPGLYRMRVPPRFYVFVSLALAWLAAFALDRLRERLPGARGVAFSALLIGLMVLELAPRPMVWWRLETEETLEPVYRWLIEQDDVAVLAELPAGDSFLDIGAMYAQSFHHRPLLNGYSGYLPPGYLEFVACCGPSVPTDETLDQLRRRGVSHVLIRPPRRWNRRKLQQLIALEDKPGVELAYRYVRGPHQLVVLRLLPP